jgi:hypothetical protein
MLAALYFFLYSSNKVLFYISLFTWAFVCSLVFKDAKRKLLFFSVLLLLPILYGILQLPNVQTYLTQRVSAFFSEKLHTKVSVKKVDIGFFNKAIIEGVMIEDLKKDTLLYAGKIKGNVNDWFFFKDKITIENIGLDDVVMNLHRKDSVWNYQFLIDYFDSPSTKKTSSTDPNIDLKEVHFKNIRFKKIDEWIGQDMLASLGSMDMATELIDTKNKKIHIKTISLEKPFFAMNDYEGRKPVNNNVKPQKLSIANAYKWNTGGWEIKLDKLDLADGAFKNDKQTEEAPYTDRFDGLHLYFGKINGSIKNVLFFRDTLTASLKLNSLEKSGLEIKKIEANFKFTPEIMEFSKLDLITNRSRLRDYYAMRYQSFNKDFGNFLEDVTLEGRFKESILSSDDLAIFAPALKSWKRTFTFEGNAKGVLDNLTAKDMKIKSGNTYVEGNIALRGLPDIEATFIDFQSKDLRTTFDEVASILPQIKDIKRPAIAKLGAVTFIGNFIGFIRDFVAYGKFNTALGNVTADINMKTPEGSPAKYSGTIVSNNFKIGTFINTPQLGAVALNVKLKGTGFDLKDLEENVEGNIDFIEAGNYTYRNIAINGNFKNKLFSGKASINDENLHISSLDGSINFLDKTPGFKLVAKVEEADLKKLGLTKDNFKLQGDFDLNFTGSNIDNFLGTAKISNARLQQGAQKLSFDYLNINSEFIDGKKSLALNTNEINANVTGNFKILELPAAVRVLLAKYYPTYIKAPSYIVKSTQDFNFSVQTNNVDEYVKLLDKKLSGFNNANVSGSFNLKNYDLQLTATVPQFSYDGKIINNTVLNAIGTKDTLKADIAIEDVTINDSLHLPNSRLSIAANNDLSLIKLNTSASKIFGDAELNASVQTMSDGVKVHFYPSSFIINKKKWQLDKDGEITLTNKFIDASEVKFFSGNQEIVLKTEQDTETNSNNLVAKLKNINIEDFGFILPKEPSLKGFVTGDVVVKNVLKKPLIHFEGSAENFELDKKYLGKENITADVNTALGIIDFTVNTNEKDYQLDVVGRYNYKNDSTITPLQIDVNTERFNLDILKPYLAGIFSDLSGSANGFIQLKQTDKKLTIVGNPIINNGSIKIGYTQVRYNFDKQVIHFGKDVIDLGDLQVKDTLGNTGMVSGKIFHNFFDNFSFEKLKFSTPRMLVLNTKRKDNQQFYGKIIGKANMTLNGDIRNMKMNIDGEPSSNLADSNHVYLPTGDTKESNAIDYIDFVQFGSQMDKDLSNSGGANLLVELDLNANEACKIDVILDEQTGDVIKGEGNGKINIKVGTNEPLSIRGRYDITQGFYTFNFQTFLKIPFTMNKGGSIVWNGDPLLANIDMEAEYLAKNVDITSITRSSGSESAKRQQEDIRIRSRLTGVLNKPIINFELVLPERSIFRSDYYVVKKLADYRNDENEMNKQVASLLLFNQFINDGNFNAGVGTVNIATGTIGGAISSWLTSVLSRALERATKGFVSIVVDVNPSLNTQQVNQLQANIRSSIQFRFSKNLRLLVGGNLDYNNPVTQLYSQNASVITPDISLEWLINKDGNLRVVAFNRTTIDATTISQQNRSAIQLSYRKDVDKIGDIFRSKEKIKKLEAKRNSEKRQ